MSVEQADTIDFISVSSDGKEVELTVSDHMDWSNVDRHIALLQSKIYRYLDFVASSELLQKYPLGER